MIEILTPFERATHCIQGDKVITGSMALPCVRILKAEMEVLCSKFVATLKDSLHKRLSHYEEHDGFQTAAALHPRFKLQWCSQAEMPRYKYSLIAKAGNIVPIQLIQAAFSPNESIPNPEPPTKKHFGFFISLIHVPVNDINTQSSIELEIQKYPTTPCLPEESEPLSFWKKHTFKFPTLSLLSRNLLCIQACFAL